MGKRFFQSRHQQALQPQAWRFVSSLFPSEVASRGNRRRQEWLTDNQESHAHLEVLLALGGEGWYGLRGKTYRMVPGTVMFFDSHEVHQAGYPPFVGEQEHLWLSIVPGHCSARILRVGGEDSDLSSSATALCRQEAAGVSLDRWSFGYAGRDGVSRELRRDRLCATIAGIIVALRIADSAPAPVEDLQVSQQRIIDAVRTHIRETAGKGASLEDLARIAGYSKFHFHRLFRQHCGETVQEYIDKCRRSRVREHLAEGLSKKAIASELGFSCPAAFSRWLRDKG